MTKDEAKDVLVATAIYVTYRFQFEGVKISESAITFGQLHLGPEGSDVTDRVQEALDTLFPAV